MKRPDYLKPSTWLQLQAVLGLLLTSPAWLLVYKLLSSMQPLIRDLPLWLLLTVPAGAMLACFIWFRQCLSPDGTSFTPKWW